MGKRNEIGMGRVWEVVVDKEREGREERGDNGHRGE